MTSTTPTLLRALRRAANAPRALRTEIRRRARDRYRERVLAAYEQAERPELVEARRENKGRYERLARPLVTVMVATYSRADILVGQTLPAVLAQTYDNLEVLVVGDHCADDTPERVKSITDPRFSFEDLSVRSVYPTDPKHRHCVAGVVPMNRALECARGDWIAYVDDDDVFEPDHVEKLLAFAHAGDHEFVFACTLFEKKRGEWERRGLGPTLPTGRPPFTGGIRYIPHSTVLYRSYLRLFRYDIESWKMHMGADAQRWMRMGRAGVTSGFLDEVVTRVPLRPHEMERTRWQPE